MFVIATNNPEGQLYLCQRADTIDWLPDPGQARKFSTAADAHQFHAMPPNGLTGPTPKTWTLVVPYEPEAPR